MKPGTTYFQTFLQATMLLLLLFVGSKVIKSLAYNSDTANANFYEDNSTSVANPEKESEEGDDLDKVLTPRPRPAEGAYGRVVLKRKQSVPRQGPSRVLPIGVTTRIFFLQCVRSATPACRGARASRSPDVRRRLPRKELLRCTH